MSSAPNSPPPLFQSTLPVKGATSRRAGRLLFRLVSIHAPREGSDWTLRPVSSCSTVSIHAPREGSDVLRLPHDRRDLSFNPRSP